MSRTPTEVAHDPVFRELNLSAEVKRMWGPHWNSPEIAYEFGDRKFYLRTEDAAIYSGIVSAGIGGSLLLEQGGYILQEDGSSKFLIEITP